MSAQKTMSEATQNRLDALTNTMRPNNIKFSLALDGNHSLEETAQAAAGILERLQAFIKNNHSTEGLGFSYASVVRHKAAAKYADGV